MLNKNVQKAASVKSQHLMWLKWGCSKVKNTQKAAGLTLKFSKCPKCCFEKSHFRDFELRCLNDFYIFFSIFHLMWLTLGSSRIDFTRKFFCPDPNLRSPIFFLKLPQLLAKLRSFEKKTNTAKKPTIDLISLLIFSNHLFV